MQLIWWKFNEISRTVCASIISKWRKKDLKAERYVV